MALSATFRPLTQWPGKKTPSYARKRAPFRAGYPRTLDDLAREIDHLNGKSVVIQVDLEPRDIRNDGWPRSSARPKEPGVVVSFTSAPGPLSFPCDTYDSWEDNLRAIALSLAALRAVDRYGVTKHSEQYRGFAQLPSPDSTADRSWALRFIMHHSGMEGVSAGEMYRSAARKLHPDAGGSHDLFVELQRAKQVLGL